MKEFYKKTLFVADIYKRSECKKSVNFEECRIHYEYKYLGKGIFTKTKNGYKHIIKNLYMPHPTICSSRNLVINEETVLRLEEYLKNYPQLNTKHKNHFSLNEIVEIEKEFNKQIIKQENEFVK